MNKFKTSVFFVALLVVANGLKAQSLEEGKKFLYYERYQSAKDVFQKLVTAEPNNEEAVYYLGQAEIGLDDVSGAKALYLQKLSANPNSPLIMAGVGNVELIEGKTADARNHFETAISLSQGKSIAVLNAVGYANASYEIKNGDPNYAIAKLTQATQLKKFKDPEVWTNLGDAYRKIGDGGNAIKAYQEALALDPKYARAIYRSGRIYQTQGIGQENLYLDYYNKAIAADPAYAPVYYTLYVYYYESNVPKSAEYLDKWLTNSDDDSKACYLRASIKYAQGLFTDAISKADQCINAEGDKPFPNLYGIKALAYNRLHDSLNAKSSYEEYFKRQAPDKIGAGDYASYASILLKFPGNEAQAGTLVDKAVALDTIENNKVAYLKSMAKVFETTDNRKEAAKWYGKVIDVKKNYSNVDLFNAGYNYYSVGELDSSIRYFNLYAEKYPDDILGYYMLGNANALKDSTNALGLAVPYYQKTIQIGEADPTKPNAKTRLMNSYKFFVGYFYNAKKNRDSALVYVDKALALDPTDASMISNKEFISKNDPNAPPKKAPEQKPATTKPKSGNNPKKK
ncbi:MAG: tetratricopeptide repeat protein [Bacteroidetes bacterium]|nr:tetratricopeptide repeat protein [Bacteroidota bacterium]MBS1756708.1 tetratricopeptide repeat protein [Bacteroidota bacterium]